MISAALYWTPLTGRLWELVDTRHCDLASTGFPDLRAALWQAFAVAGWRI